jgi:pimeloyl-ACP methyl ester carboxylesterase
MKGMKESFYEVNGIRLHVTESGPADGPVVIFLHGYPEFGYGWRKQIPFFAAQGFRVVVPDQRGYNLSSKPPGTRAYRVSQLTQDIVELIAALGTEKVLLVGHDWGGAVAWNLAMHHPQLLRRLVIINMPHPVVMRKTLRKRLNQLRRSWYIFFFQLPLLPEWVISRGHFRLMRNSLQRTSLPGTFSEADLKEYVAAWSQPGAFRAMINWYRAAVRHRNPALAQPPEVQTPMLMIWGAQDAFLRTEMAEESLHYCRNGKLHLIPGATHWVHHEKSEEVNQAILNFIGSADQNQYPQAG